MTVFLEKNGYTIFRCPACGLGRTQLGKNYETFVAALYDKGYFTGDPLKSAYANYKEDKPFIVKNMRHFLRKITAYKPSGRLLDVGCALGFFVELARSKGFDAYGFDPSAYAVGEAKKLVGHDRIQQGTIHSVSYPLKSFDVITLFDVFEHLGDPRADIQKLSRYLADDGVLVIATGDTNSLMAKALRRRWTFYIPPQHLFFFNKTTMTQLLHQCRLRPAEWFRIGKWLSLRYVLHLARTTGESRIAHTLYTLMKRFKAEHVPLWLPVGDNMVAVIRKLRA